MAGIGAAYLFWSGADPVDVMYKGMEDYEGVNLYDD